MARDIKVKVTLGQTVVKIKGGQNPYTEEYIVDPDFEEKTLKTKDKFLTDNIKINPIKVESVSNLSGGRTVYIGGNINYG